MASATWRSKGRVGCTRQSIEVQEENIRTSIVHVYKLQINKYAYVWWSVLRIFLLVGVYNQKGLQTSV